MGPNGSLIEITGHWALQAPYVLSDDEFDLTIEHHTDGIAVTAPVGWRVHVPTHSGVRYVQVPEGWSTVVPLATQCVIFENGELFINLTDREPEHAPGQVEISSDQGRCRLWWHYGAQAPLFRVLRFESWDDLIADQQDWMRQVTGIKPLEEVAPPWLQKCPLVVYVDIETISGDGLHHSFDDVTALARTLGDLDAPAGTLFYLTTWNDRYERRFPTYEASGMAGGLDALRAASEAIHEQGFRMMLHSNVWGASRRHPDWTQFVGHIVHSRLGHPLGWREYYKGYISDFMYVRPNARPFREAFWGSLREVAAATHLDALYLDHAGLLVDDPRCSILEATRTLIGDIRDDRPDLVLGGQVLTSRLCDLVNLWQLWGTPWSGQGWAQPFRRRSPIVADLFRGFTRFLAHMHLPAAVPGRYMWTHEQYQNDLGTVGAFLAAQEDNTYHGAIPSVRLNFREHGVDPLSYEVIFQAARRAERLHGGDGTDAPPPPLMQDVAAEEPAEEAPAPTQAPHPPEGDDEE